MWTRPRRCYHQVEHGGIITTTTSAFGSKTKTKKHKIADRYLSPDIFWPEEEGF